MAVQPRFQVMFVQVNLLVIVNTENKLVPGSQQVMVKGFAGASGEPAGEPDGQGVKGVLHQSGPGTSFHPSGKLQEPFYPE